MAQLSDDCFAFGGPMMSVDEAVGIIAARVTPVGEVETVSLAQADGRILASEISAPLPLPPFTNSAADGHAVRKAGQRLRPQDIALAAAFGLTEVEVRRRIRVAVFSTGNELVSPGAPRAAAQLFDSNRFMLMAMFYRLGCEVSDLGILRDDRASLASGLKQVAAAHDL